MHNGINILVINDRLQNLAVIILGTSIHTSLSNIKVSTYQEKRMKR